MNKNDESGVLGWAFNGMTFGFIVMTILLPIVWEIGNSWSDYGFIDAVFYAIFLAPVMLLFVAPLPAGLGLVSGAIFGVVYKATGKVIIMRGTVAFLLRVIVGAIVFAILGAIVGAAFGAIPDAITFGGGNGVVEVTYFEPVDVGEIIKLMIDLAIGGAVFGTIFGAIGNSFTMKDKSNKVILGAVLFFLVWPIFVTIVGAIVR